MNIRLDFTGSPYIIHDIRDVMFSETIETTIKELFTARGKALKKITYTLLKKINNKNKKKSRKNKK